MIRSLPALALVVAALGGAPLHAQARPTPQDPRSSVPRTHLPPPGMCRIWLENVPPAQQPAPTDCASAVRNLPRNGRVIFSEDPRNPKLPLVKNFRDPAPKSKPTETPAGSTAKTVRPDPKRVIKPDRPNPEP